MTAWPRLSPAPREKTPLDIERNSRVSFARPSVRIRLRRLRDDGARTLAANDPFPAPRPESEKGRAAWRSARAALGFAFAGGNS